MVEWQIGSCRFRVSCLFFAVSAVLLIVDQSGVALAGLMASLMHETGHLTAMLLCRQPPCAITLGIFGMRVEYPAQACLSYGRSAFISVSGPAVNLLTAGLLLRKAYHSPLFWIHLSLGVFNLLPVDALDGGQCLKFLLLTRFQPERAEKAVTVLSIFFIFLLTLLGIALFCISGYNFTLFLFALYPAFLLILKKKD